MLVHDRSFADLPNFCVPQTTVRQGSSELAARWRTPTRQSGRLSTSPASRPPAAGPSLATRMRRSQYIHVTVGAKARSANGFTSHLLSVTVQFLTEMLVVEVLSPTMSRPRHPELYDVPLVQFDR